jgi:hypothetical protein
MPQLILNPKLKVRTNSTKITLADGEKVMVHVVQYDMKQFRPRVVSFDKATYLTEWCQQNDFEEAMVGGFVAQKRDKSLGELWVDGHPRPYAPFAGPWESVRGSLYIDKYGQPKLGSRVNFPKRPAGDLLQAGPLLVRSGVSQIVNKIETEGVSISANQFDDDITIGRFPRSAIALNKISIWSIVCDGSTSARTGLDLSELADIAISLGADSALNLDGGGSATQISGGKLRNHPYGDGQFYPNGRPIYSAIIFCRR